MERDEKRELLISLREKAGLNRKEFAAEFDIPYPTISDWEHGNRRIPEYFLRLLQYRITSDAAGSDGGLASRAGVAGRNQAGRVGSTGAAGSDGGSAGRVGSAGAATVTHATDCCFTSGNDWFRYRAAGIIVEGDRTLFVTNNKCDYFYTVGGGVFMGETSEECVKREIFEETGVHYEVDHLAVVVENFFLGKGGKTDDKDCHVIEFYYLMKPRGTTELKATSTNSDNAEEVHRWLRVDEMQNYNVKPSFLKDRFDEIVHGNKIIHIVSEADRR